VPVFSLGTPRFPACFARTAPRRVARPPARIEASHSSY